MASVDHTVTALVRDTSKVQSRPGLTYVRGTPTNLDDVRAAFQEPRPDGVLVTLSAPRQTDSPFAKSIAPPRLMADSVQNAATAMKEHGVRRIIIMQAFGVGSSYPNLNFLMRLVVKKSEMCTFKPQ